MPTEYTDKDNPHRRDDDEPTRDQKGNRISRAIVALKDTIGYEAYAGRQQGDTQEREKKYREIATLVFVIITTSFVATQAYYMRSSDTAQIVGGIDRRLFKF